MVSLTLSTLAAKLSATLIGADTNFSSICTDTRQLVPGDLFIALQGPHYNGHDFIPQAIAKGACAIVASQDVNTEIPLLKVADTRLALGQLAKLRRAAFHFPVVAITGSCGKTTTKMLTAAILAQCGNTLFTEGTLNNDIGVPLTLFRLTDEHRFAVIELGANHPGEIAYIADITQPDIAVITNAAPVHLEGFGSLEGVAKSKGEIYGSLPDSGIAIINADDAFADDWRQMNSRRKVLTFGIEKTANISARQLTLDALQQPVFELVTPAGNAWIRLNLIGKHNVLNALAAAAAAYALGVTVDIIKKGLEAAQPVDKRLVRYQGLHGAVVIDDSYNANPQAFKAAVSILSQAKGKKIAIMGDMAELGDKAADYHAEVGRFAKAQGIDQLYTVGKLSLSAAEAFGVGACHCPDQQTLIAAVKMELDAETTVLIKGSRSAKMEHVVASLAAINNEGSK